MNLEVGRLYNISEALNLLIQGHRFKASTALNLAIAFKKTNEVFEIANSQRDELIKRHADKDEEGNVITDEKGAIPSLASNKEFLDEHNQLMASSIELNIKPIKIGVA